MTDRDIVVRGIAKEKSTPPRELYARDVATKDVEAVSSRDSISHVLELMGRKQNPAGPRRRREPPARRDDLAR